jgi:hypothetical protein
MPLAAAVKANLALLAVEAVASGQVGLVDDVLAAFGAVKLVAVHGMLVGLQVGIVFIAVAATGVHDDADYTLDAIALGLGVCHQSADAIECLVHVLVLEFLAAKDLR